jgi:peptidyl-dipeptidase Dcp
MNQHPYFEFNQTPHGAFNFNELNLTELDKSIQTALENGKETILKIAESEEAPSFDNTILALETADEDLDRVLNVLYNLFSADTKDEIQTLVEKYSPILAEYSNSIILNEKIFKKVQSVYKNDLSKLEGESKRLTEKYYKDFVKNGAELSDSDKEKLRELDQKLSGLSPQFSKNSLEATNAFEWTTTEKDKLKGLPESAIEAAKEEAKLKGLPDDTYLFTLQYPSLLPILKYCEDREIREHFYKANATKAVDGVFSNKSIVKEILTLRDQKAKLLGFKTYADFVLQNRMAKSTETVFNFLEDLKKYSLEPAKKEVEEVKNFAKERDGLEDFQAWDFSYYAEKLREERFSFSEEEMKPYFPLNQVLDGAFLHAEKLYGVVFKETKEVSTYHPDVMVYEVFAKDTKDFIGLFYADFYPRASKRSGAWCTHFRSQGLLKGEIRRPHVSIVCNFTKPTESKPSLLTFNETRTLFHEFGHALHELLSQCTYSSLGGTSVYWDFVELPSQIMENWVLEEESLKLFAKHYKTGEVIPKDYVTKIKTAETFLSGYNCVRQLRFATLDMKYHTMDPSKIKDIEEFENENTKEFDLLPRVEGANFSCSFGHIFAGGYAAGYYSYKWAEVLDADAFELFKEKGIFNEEVSKSFKTNILERGGTEDPDKLYLKFRGQEPDVKALLRRDNLIQDKSAQKDQ